MNEIAPQNAFECELQLRWSDQDLNGHINNARVTTLIEEARVLAGQIWSGCTPDGRTPRVVRNLFVRFDRAVHYDFALHAKVWISHTGDTSYTVCHELIQRDVRCVYAEAVIVVLDGCTGRPTSLSSDLRHGLGRFQVPSDDPLEG